ncbi:glycoside hydrolase family 3 protein [Enterococcus sp. LJL98]
MNKKKWAWLFSLVIVFFAIGGGLWWLQVQPSTSSEPERSTTSTSDTQSNTSTTTRSNSSSSSESSTLPSSSESRDRLSERLEAMTLEEKVGQLFLARYPGASALDDLAQYALGGYLFFGQDFEAESAESVRQRVKQLQAEQKIPLFLGADEEGGTVTRLSWNATLVDQPFQAPQVVYQQGGWEAIAADTRAKAAVLQAYGLQLGLFPVADVATDPNAFIYDRTIGLDAQGTSVFVETVVEALKGSGVASTLKHFPGYGNNRDSHVEIVHDTRALEELQTNDFLPFEAGIKAGVDSILVSHNIVTSIDDRRPASISPQVIAVLRQSLGFEGVIMTDDMDMLGLADFIPQEQAALAALQAGNDLILSSSYQRQIPVVIAAVEAGDYAEADLDASVRRVLRLKEKLGMFPD